MELENNNHSVFEMEYQLFLSTNRLHPVIDKTKADRLKGISRIVDRLPKGQFWSRTFCLVTLDHGLDMEKIKDFIDKQKS